MRFRHPNSSIVHLSYCSNVHSAADAEGVIAQLARFAAPLRETLGVPRLGVGLWLAAPAAATLLENSSALSRLRSQLDRHDLEVVTFNGFPYRAFHAPVVKRAVYIPDWTDRARADYTLDLARLMVSLLPDDVEGGSISTLPLGWRVGWSEKSTDLARYALERVARELAKLAARTGHSVRLGLEPEPGCAVETVGELPRCSGTWIRIGSGSASTPATWRCSSRSPRHLSLLCAAQMCRSSKLRSRTRCGQLALGRRPPRPSWQTLSNAAFYTRRGSEPRGRRGRRRPRGGAGGRPPRRE